MVFATIFFSTNDGIARLTLNRPKRPNSFTVQMHREVSEALNMLEAAPEVHALLITGAGRGFCAGQDLFDRAVVPGQAVDLGDSVERLYNPLIRRLVALPFPVVCAVNGVAWRRGAGARIALAADIVIAAKSARFIQSFAKIGLIPDSGGTWVLPRLVGQTRAQGMALTGNPVSAEQAAAWGLIWEAVEDDALAATVEVLLTQFAQAPTVGLAATKQLIRASWLHSLDEELDLQRDAMHRLDRTEDYHESVAAFIAKRKPNFQGR